jgi:protocatechuate 3,4-dioxygenase beta subunit
MQANELKLNRRRFIHTLSAVSAGAAIFAVPGVYADELVRTPRQTEGPFYPSKLPLDTDNDLLVINDSTTPASGQATLLSGRILDSRGDPLRNVMVEIWQCDNNGVYLHPNSANNGKRDPNFQGFGRFLTGSSGEYLFRTIKPVPYPGRTGHVHFAVKIRGQETFTTQCYVKGEPLNDKDGVLKEIKDPKAKASVIIPFTPLAGSRADELAARFDIVLGYTPSQT